MKRLFKHLFPILLLCLSVILLCTACQNTPPATDTTAADTPAQSGEDDPEATNPADTDPANTDPTETDPAETDPVPDGVHIPDPSVSVDYTPKDGLLVQMGIFAEGEWGDAVGYAATMLAGGEIGSYEVTHKGMTYTVPAYRKTAAEGQSAALDLSAYAEDETLRAAITDGYTVELTVQLTETLGDGFQALFSATQNGMFGLALEDGKFLFQQFDSSTRDYATGGKVQVAGFGTFKVKERAERSGRNPRTNQSITIKATKLPSFVPGKCLKDAVAND